MPAMSNHATCLPIRRTGLVSWRTGENDWFLARDRRTGESFQLGEVEHFLLGQLDGRQTAEGICRAFAERFGEPLSGEDLDEFIQLAAARGLLQRDGENVEPPEWSVPNGSGPLLPSETASRSVRNRAAVRALKGVSAVLEWPARLLNAAAGRIDLFRLTRLEFVPRPDDVFIVTHPRSGTTWMQMMLYQLTTDGSMDFPHIAEYCPWFERSARSATAFETRPSPRLFKSHLPYPKIPKGPCKYIYVARNGTDVAVSQYHMERTHIGVEETFDKFFERFLTGKTAFGSWFAHVESWWRHRSDPNVLFLTYEELSRDLEGCICRVARFVGRDVPAERLPSIVERCRFAFMKQYEKQFDAALESMWERGVRLHSFLRHGRTGDGVVQLTGEQQARFDEKFNQRLKALGIPLS
jgi:hypothetical protein